MSLSISIPRKLVVMTVGIVLSAPSVSFGSGNEAVLETYIEIWNSGDLERLDSIVTEDFQRHSSVGSASSRAELAEVISRSRSFYRNFDIEILDLVAGEHKGASRTRLTGEFGAQNLTVDSLSFAMYHFTDGKLSAEWLLGNTMDMWRSFGFTLSPPNAILTPPPIQSPPGASLNDRLAASSLQPVTSASQESNRKRGVLAVLTNRASVLSVDQLEIGYLTPGKSVEIVLDRGKHLVQARSLGGSTFFDTEIRIKPKEIVEIEISAPETILQSKSETVEELESGLMWQNADNGTNINWHQASALCESLDQGGFHDWRLPSIYELQDLYSPDSESINKYKSTSGITLSDCCPWTSTPHETMYWTYVFSMGIRYLEPAVLGFHMRALCVRDTIPAGSS